MQERFALIYTGQRRLARNLLRYVVGGYIGGREESVEALEEMKHLAVLMRYELEQGNVDEFAKLLNQHWEVSKKLDMGSTNTCIDLEEMKHLAVLMRYELEQGNVDEFAKLLNQHWEVSKKLDMGSTNTCIDQIFESCEDLVDGKFREMSMSSQNY